MIRNTNLNCENEMTPKRKEENVKFKMILSFREIVDFEKSRQKWSEALANCRMKPSSSFESIAHRLRPVWFEASFLYPIVRFSKQKWSDRKWPGQQQRKGKLMIVVLSFCDSSRTFRFRAKSRDEERTNSSEGRWDAEAKKIEEELCGRIDRSEW